MAAWGVGIMMAPIFGPTLGGWISDNWSWRWIFYINVPIGIVGFLVSSAVLFDPPYLKRPGRVDVLGPRPDGDRLPLAAALPRPGRAQRVVRVLCHHRARRRWPSSALIAFLAARAHRRRADPRPHRLRRPQLRRVQPHHARGHDRLLLEHGAARALHPEGARLRRVDVRAWCWRRAASATCSRCSSRAGSSRAWTSAGCWRSGCVLNALCDAAWMSEVTLGDGLLVAGVAALRAGRRRRLHLRAAEHGGARHHRAREDGQRHRRCSTSSATSAAASGWR